MIQVRNRISEIFSFECHGRPDFLERDTQITMMGETSILYSSKDKTTKNLNTRVIPKVEEGSGIKAT